MYTFGVKAFCLILAWSNNQRPLVYMSYHTFFFFFLIIGFNLCLEYIIIKLSIYESNFDIYFLCVFFLKETLIFIFYFLISMSMHGYE